MSDSVMRRSIDVNDIDIDKFVQALNKCKGDVWLETDEGDKLNLKSALCRIMGLTNLIKGGKVANATIRCDNPEDDAMLFQLNLWNKLPENE